MKTILRSSGENSFLKDAVRDLVIVVAGILAALWLEAWWQDQLDRKEEQEILTSLRAEFEINRADLIDVMNSKQALIERIDALLELIDGPINERTESEILARLQIGGPRFFDPRSGQLTSIINSGKLGLIANNELRALVADWPALAADMDLERTVFVDITTHQWGASYRKYVGRPGTRFDTDLDALTKDRQFSNELFQYRVIFRIMLRESQAILDTTDRIIELIDAEVANH